MARTDSMTNFQYSSFVLPWAGCIPVHSVMHSNSMNSCYTDQTIPSILSGLS